MLYENKGVKVIETKKKFSETRRIEQFVIRFTPKEKYIFDQFVKQAGIGNTSDFVRKMIFKEIDNKIDSGEVTLF